MLLKDKTILVTGASSGIGCMVSIQASQEGAFLCITGRNVERLGNTKHDLVGYSCSFAGDLTNETDIESLVDSLPCLDGLVICAGINEYIPAKMISHKRLDRIFETNYFSQILLIQKLLKRKRLNKGASIVFISSISSLMGVPATLIYAASKSALNTSAKVLASELAPQKIRVNVICPGIIVSPMIGSQNIEESVFVEQEKLYPLGLGTPEDVANAVIYHLSEKSRWLTGNIMILDGGFSLQ